MPFRLVEFEEDVRLAPADLGRPPAEALTSAVEAAFVDRVVPGAGLVVAVVAPLAASGGDIHPAGGGAARWTVRFSAAVFRPAPRDIMVGTICEADSSGLSISLGFFDDVRIPPEGLPRPSAFDASRGAWVYRPGAEEGGGARGGEGPSGAAAEEEDDDDEDSDDLEMAPGVVVRFRVREVRFPERPPAGGGGGAGSAHGGGCVPQPSADGAAGPADPPPLFAPLVVIADFTDVGLGPVAWWNECEDAAAAAAEKEEE